MKIADHEANHEYCLQQAARLLGEPARALQMAFAVEQAVRKHLRLEARCGLSSEHALLTITCGPKGHQLDFGLERYRCLIDGVAVPLVKLVAPTCGLDVSSLYDFWAVPVRHFRRFYRWIRRQERHILEPISPIMRADSERLLWANTIGFLCRGQESLKKYGVPRKRGVLLTGEPGNGKTMACRWLCAWCSRRGLSWRNIAAEEYLQANSRGEVRELFEMEGQGIILFDDLDQALRDREESGNRIDQTTFLTELDGLHPREGVVYLFTTNARRERLDPAFRRPGRIDLILQFDKPDAALRRKFIEERWHGDIVRSLDVEEVMTSTNGLSFAELEELKKQLVLNFLESGAWDWQRSWMEFRENHPHVVGRSQRIGFSAASCAADRPTEPAIALTSSKLAKKQQAHSHVPSAAAK